MNIYIKMDEELKENFLRYISVLKNKMITEITVNGENISLTEEDVIFIEGEIIKENKKVNKKDFANIYPYLEDENKTIFLNNNIDILKELDLEEKVQVFASTKEDKEKLFELLNLEKENILDYIYYINKEILEKLKDTIQSKTDDEKNKILRNANEEIRIKLIQFLEFKNIEKVDIYYMTEEEQDVFVTKNINSLQKMSEKYKLIFLSDIKSEATQIYFSDVMHIEELLITLPNPFSEFHSISDELIKKYLNNNQIVEKLAEELNNRTYRSIINLEGLSPEVIDIIKDKVKNKVERDLYAEILKRFPGRKIDITNINSVIQNLPNDLKLKENLFDLTENIDKFNFKKILEMYPQTLNDSDITRILNSIEDSELDEIFAYMTRTQEINGNLKQLIRKRLQTSEKLSIDTLSLFFSNEELKQMIPKIILEPRDILSNFDDYILEILKENPYLFEDLETLPILFDPLKQNASKKGKTDYVELAYAIAKYFPEKPRYELYVTLDDLENVLKMLNENPRLIEHFRIYLNENKNIDFTKIIKENENVKKYANIDLLIDLYEKNEDKELLEIIFSKMKTDASYKLETLYKLLENEDKKRFIDLNQKNRLIINLYKNEDDEKLSNYLKEIIIKNQNSYVSAYLDMNEEKWDNLIPHLNTTFLADAFLSYQSFKLENEIYKRILEDNYALNKSLNPLDVFKLLRKEHQSEILAILNNKIDESEIKHLLEKGNINSFKLIEMYEKDKEKFNYLINLLKENTYILNTVNPDILDKKYIEIAPNFIKKVVKYPEVQKRILNIKKENQNIFTQIMQKISNDKDKIFDRKIMIILNELEKEEYNYQDLNEKELENLINYILMKNKTFQFSKRSLDIENLNPLTFKEDLIKICDEKINTNNVEDVREITLNKYFSMTKEDAEEFLRMYDGDKTNVEIEEEIKMFIEIIKEVLNEKDINVLKEFYFENGPIYSIEDIFQIENSLQISYTNELKSTMFKENNPNKILNINGENVPVIETETFQMLTHSTNAYGQMSMINDSYYDSWNMSSNIANHGICTTLISDKCLGLPPLSQTGNGCIFAFTDFNEDAITNMAPYDLRSINNEYELETSVPLIYTSSKDFISKTRHTHNEIVLERKTKEGKNLSPNYVIITSEMNDNQRKNAVKASKEMNVQIIYLDIKKILEKNKENIQENLIKFQASNNLNYLKEALDIYDTVTCTTFNIKDYEFIDVEVFNQIINDFIEISDEENLDTLKEILENEKSKYDLFKDFASRAKKITIDYKNIMEEIEKKRGKENVR